jgi:hypothetical protein
VQEKFPPPDEKPKPVEQPKTEQPERAQATKEYQPNPAVTSKEGVGRSTQPVTSKGEEPAPVQEEQWERNKQRMLVCGAYSITASRTGNWAVAYNTTTREVKVVRLSTKQDQPLWVTPVAIDAKDPHLVALGVRGERITRVAVFNLRSGKWAPLKLDQPVNGAVWPMSIGPQTVAYEVGEFLYLYNPKIDAWDRLDVRTFGDDTQEPRATEVR